MHVVSETEERTIRTAAATMYGLAGPSQGSAEVCTWRVVLGAGNSTPEHAIDREQVWMPLSGAFEIVADGSVERIGAGQAVILPAGVVRRVTALGGPAEALVAMGVDGRATVPGGDGALPLPWAQ